MSGGDLRFHISRKTFTEEAVKFWIAELGCALRYIHKQGIVHRDVKPDNVLLDSEGHIHLADFVCSSDFFLRGITNLIECRIGFYCRKAFDKQVWVSAISVTGSLGRDRVFLGSRLVVIGGTLL